MGRADQAQELERYGLKPWIEAAKRRLHHNVLAVPSNAARIAWSVLARGRDFETRRSLTRPPKLSDRRARDQEHAMM